MDEFLAGLVGVIIVIAIVIYVIMWIVQMIVMAVLWVASLIYTSIVWTANAFLAGLDAMFSFGPSVPLWVSWTIWGLVLGGALGYASSAAASQQRRAFLYAPLTLMIVAALMRNLQ